VSWNSKYSSGIAVLLRISREQAGRRSCDAEVTINAGFQPTSKRKRGFPSETRVKRGLRIVHGDKELSEKLGRRDLCPCGSRRRFQVLLHEYGQVRWLGSELLLLEVEREGERRRSMRTKWLVPSDVCRDD
jgi:hypothetical protein